MSKRVKNRKRKNVRETKEYAYMELPGYREFSRQELEQLHRQLYPIRKDLREQEKRRRAKINTSRKNWGIKLDAGKIN